jgi:uncharacterized protein YndB with AHSA1/START domain
MASRVIAAPPDRVFAALVDPEALTAWLPPADGMSGRFERFDARPGGSYRLVLTYADASSARGKATADSDIVEAHFVDVVPGVQVVQAIDFVSDDPTHIKTESMRFAPRSAPKGAGNAGWRHVYKSAVTAASFYIRPNSGPLVKGGRSGTRVASARGSVVDHTESVSNHAGSQQASA